MPFTFSADALLTSEEVSKFIFGVDDAATGPLQGGTYLTPQQIFQIETAVNALSNQFVRYLSVNIKTATYTEVWDGAASDELVPRAFPIQTVSSIKFSTNGDFPSVSPQPIANYSYTQDSIVLRGLRFPTGRALIEVIYTAGYTTVPSDIVFAALLQFQWMYKKFGKGDGMIGLQSVSKSIGGGSESQTKDPSIGKEGLLSEVIGMLRPYLRFEAPLSIMFSRTS